MLGLSGFSSRLSRYRPEAVNISNVSQLVDADGKPHFKYIIEGANLFLTQQARLWLEKRNVVVIKDSSANKVCRARFLFTTPFPWG